MTAHGDVQLARCPEGLGDRNQDAACDPGCILVVDDDRVNRLVAEGLLHAEGFEVKLASSGPEALERLAEGDIDLILLDVMMPEMDGFETLAALRSTPQGSDVPVVFLTALSDLETHGRAIASSADDFLNKPINPTALTMRVRSLLRLRRARQDLKRAERTLRGQRDRLALEARWRRHLRRLVVHDLRNPLGTLLLTADYFAGQEGLPAASRQSMDDVVETVQRMRRLITDFSDVDGSLHDGLRVSLRATTLSAMLNDARRAAAEEPHPSDATLRWDVAPDLPTLDLDPVLLQRAVLALIRHARDNAPPDSEIRLRAHVEDRAVKIEVSDQGSAVDPAQVTALFEPWNTETSGEPGQRRRADLALPLARLVAEAHGGAAYIRAGEQGATVVGLELPSTHDMTSRP